MKNQEILLIGKLPFALE